MSKGLEALEELKQDLTPMHFSRIERLDRYKIIEKELKRLEEIDNGAHVPVHINRYNELCDKEKALEIMTKSLDIKEEDFFYDSKENVYYFVGSEIPKEEYDFLKEVLL